MGLPGLHARPGSAGKKLAEAARLWARGELQDEHEQARQQDEARSEVDAALAAFGRYMQEDDTGGARAPAGKVFYLWPENERAWNFFLCCSTQWHWANTISTGISIPHRTGLDYGFVELLMERQHIRRGKRARMFRQVQAMEYGALKGWREQQAEYEATRR